MKISKYHSDDGFKYEWENGFYIETTIDESVFLIKANKAGLISLANHLLGLAQEEVPLGFHLHFDENNSLEDGSTELIFEKK
ncbi:Imm32 family immunity protein [Thiofilum flexile]|uniref:Imm32 family immunity protein n=1 Tax=Thiofilum flexile TaxID=125627 RepID=UPI00035CA87E|nr:hypothetical protein [Thiofilum flexile]